MEVQTVVRKVQEVQVNPRFESQYVGHLGLLARLKSRSQWFQAALKVGRMVVPMERKKAEQSQVLSVQLTEAKGLEKAGLEITRHRFEVVSVL